MSVGQNLPNVAIGYARGRLLMLFAAGLALTAVCAALASNWQQGNAVTTFEVAACYIGAVFFGLFTCRMLWRLSASTSPVVVISRVGIRDARLADETIAWSSVRKIMTLEKRTQKFVVLKVEPLVAGHFSGGLLKRVAALTSREIGSDDVIVNASGLTMDVETLSDTCKQYWGAGRPAHAEEPVPESEAEAEPEPVG